MFEPMYQITPRAKDGFVFAAWHSRTGCVRNAASIAQEWIDEGYRVHVHRNGRIVNIADLLLHLPTSERHHP